MALVLVLDISTSDEWHLQKAGTEYGPYTYEEILKMLQDHHIYESDYVWSPHLDVWTEIGSLPEFSSDRISRIVEKTGNNSDVFHERSHDRVRCNFDVIAHDNSKYWTGKMESISEGGALILMSNPLLLPGELITIHCSENSHIKTSFNTRAEVIAKRLIKGRIEHDTGIYYAVKFFQLQPVGRTQIQQFVKEHNQSEKKKKGE
jgi:hypothetical protein